MILKPQLLTLKIILAHANKIRLAIIINKDKDISMASLFEFLAVQPYILLFLVVGLAVLTGRFTIKGYGLGMVAGAIVVGCAFSVWASTYGVSLSLDEFTKSLFYYLFMYGVGLRVGPSFVNSFKGDGLKFTCLAVVSCFAGLLIIVGLVKFFALPQGAAGGILAGSMTMSAALGSAEQAVTSGALTLQAGETASTVTGMIALSYGITYIWGTVGIIIICKYLPKWWGIDARQAAKDYEANHDVSSADEGSLTAYLKWSYRAYTLENPELVGVSIHQFHSKYPQYGIIRVARGDSFFTATPEFELALNDQLALSGSHHDLTEDLGLIGPEIDNKNLLNVELAQAEVIVSQAVVCHTPLSELKSHDVANDVQLTKMERGGVPYPISPTTELQKRDILTFVGVKAAIERIGERMGQVVYPSTSTDLFTLSVGMILGLLIGLIEFPAFGAKVGLGSAGGLLVSGVLVSSIASRLRFFGNTPNAARNIIEDIGLIVFVAIVGINAGAGLLSDLSVILALKIFFVGFMACSIPPILVWIIGWHIMKLNPAILMGAVAGARSHSGPCREAANEINSNVPWIGFPVGYAIAGILLTIFGYFAMILAG
jgi:putative transport protein